MLIGSESQTNYFYMSVEKWSWKNRLKYYYFKIGPEYTIIVCFVCIYISIVLKSLDSSTEVVCVHTTCEADLFPFQLLKHTMNQCEICTYQFNKIFTFYIVVVV